MLLRLVALAAAVEVAMIAWRRMTFVLQLLVQKRLSIWRFLLGILRLLLGLEVHEHTSFEDNRQAPLADVSIDVCRH